MAMQGDPPRYAARAAPAVRSAAGKRRRNRSRRGAAVVEFALVVPLLSLLLLGLFEFGRVLMVQQVLTNAAREAVREASLFVTSTDAVKDAAYRFTDAANLNQETIEIVISKPPSSSNIDPQSVDPGEEVRVSVEVPIESVSWLSSNWFPQGYKVKAAGTMRKEGFD